MSRERKSRTQKRGKLNTKEDEEKVYEFLLNNVGDSNYISRYVLEGHLLYTFNLSNAKAYQVIMNLTFDDVLKLVEKTDGEYYLFKAMKGENLK